MNDTAQANNILVTGGAGFIGSALIRYLMQHTQHTVVNYDKLTYAASLTSLSPFVEHPRYHFVEADINDGARLKQVLRQHRIDRVIHLAAESHVDRSIEGPRTFIDSNIVGTFELLQQCLCYYRGLSEDAAERFRFHHVSTDEVFGDLADGERFNEQTPYAPSSPYSASKAAADHLVRAWHRTYGLPVVISNCSNNYGPYQYPEKLIPVAILNALTGKPIPVYGNGQQIRDWLYVEDHAIALVNVAFNGAVGESYNIGGGNERTNLELVTSICHQLNRLVKHKPNKIEDFTDLIQLVEDRPGHDTRYAIDAGKVTQTLNWQPGENIESGLKKTVQWYLDNIDWCHQMLKSS